MAAETINELTTGVLTQGVSAGGSLFNNQLAGYQDQGSVTAGNTLVRDFRTRNAISVTQAQSIRDQLNNNAGTAVFELHVRNNADEVLNTLNFTVVPGSASVFDHGPGGVPSRRYRCLFQIDMSAFHTADELFAPMGGTDFSNFEITRQSLVNLDITSHRNFNFNNTVTLDLIPNAIQLGTDAQGRIIPSSDIPINITTGPTFDNAPNPNRGDYHILTAQVQQTESAVEVLQAGGANVTLNIYAPSGYFQSFDQGGLMFDNVQISHDRGTIDPPLGVAGQPVEVFYRTGADQPWQTFGTTIDSSSNGNQRRVRFEAGVATGASVGDTLGVDSGNGVSVGTFEPGTYIFGGDRWIQISGNTSMTASSGQYVDDIQFITDLNSGVTDMVLAYEGSGDTVREAVPDIWPLYLRTTNDFFNTVADRRRVALPQTLTADHVGQVLQVVEQANGIRNLEFTTPDAANITVEGNDGSTENNAFDSITRIDFNHNDFFVNAGDAGEVIVTSRGGAGGGVLIQEDGRSEVDVAQTINLRGGLLVTPDNENPADATTVDIAALATSRIGSSGQAVVNNVSIFSGPATIGNYTLPAITARVGTATVNLVTDGDFLILRNSSAAESAIVSNIVAGTTQLIDGTDQTLTILPGEVVTLVYSDKGVSNSNTAASWITTHRSGGTPTHLHSVEFEQTTEASSWEIPRSMFNITNGRLLTRPIVQVYETTGTETFSQVIPDTIDVSTDENAMTRITITFSTNVAGHVTVLG